MSTDPQGSEAEGQPLWAGRFGEGPSDELLAFTVSLPFDRRLAGDDLAGSRAHVHMLERVGLLDEQERQVIDAALGRVEEELVEGAFAFAPTDEDIHTAIERRVTEIAGATGAKLHTGRSRNDQVALDLRLYVRREAHVQAARIHELQSVLLRRAEEAADVYLPGYTHLQRAQPVLLAHHLLAHFWALDRDLDRWRDCVARSDVSPLGAGALAGSSLPLDPDLVANELGFPSRVRELARRRVGSRLRGRGLVRRDAHAGASVAPRRGDRAVGHGGVRLPPPGRRVLDRFVDAAPEEESRHRRARARQGRPPDRQPHRVPGDPEGSAARVQPRPPGRQGTAVRRARHVRSVAARALRPSRFRRIRRRAHDGRRGRPDRARRPISRSTSSSGARRSAKRTRSSAGSYGRRSSGACRSTSWSRTTPISDPTAFRCSNRGARCGGGRHRGAAAPSRWRGSWRRHASGSRRSRAGWTAEPRAPAIVLRSRRPHRGAAAAQQGAGALRRGAAGRRRASSRRRPTAAPTIPAATPTGARRRAMRRCSGRRGISTSTSPTATTGA